MFDESDIDDTVVMSNVLTLKTVTPVGIEQCKPTSSERSSQNQQPPSPSHQLVLGIVLCSVCVCVCVCVCLCVCVCVCPVIFVFSLSFFPPPN